jgi:hypothetical protein
MLRETQFINKLAEQKLLLKVPILAENASAAEVFKIRAVAAQKIE